MFKDEKIKKIMPELLQPESNESKYPDEYEKLQKSELPKESIKDAKTMKSQNKSDEVEDHDESFQSLSDSINNVAEPQLNDNNLTQHRSTVRFSFSRDYSLTEKIPIGRLNESEHSRSLTKPIFMDSKGVLRFNESIESPVDITDDESQGDVEMEELLSSPEVDDNEENNITLNLSDGSDGEKNTNDAEEKDVSFEKTSTLIAADSQSKPLELKKRSKSPSPRFESSSVRNLYFIV